ncbi:conserved hypothetical protein [Culex quinquefasciatus]|uniref:Uncharacterized protein n=1 Tax=Culex quinquefasciatus TaxID=7176 RepID=B0X711_CULQU|nr:conserved hypothetical protein [Culex quinquefasciatus]|eukprot:XP_001865433.1 conserved hypothetical protein [Culex quinquefasciatus]
MKKWGEIAVLKYGAVPRLDANEENYFDVEYLEDETVQDDSLTAPCNAAMRSSTGCWTVSHISSDALTDNVRPEVYRLDFNDEQDFKIIKNSNATTSSPTNNGQPTWSESSFIEESISKDAPGTEACNMDCDDELFSTTSPSAARRSSTGSWTVSHLSADALTDNVRPEDEKDFGPDVSNMDCDDELLSTISPGAAKRSSTESCTVSHLSTDASPTDNARPEVLSGDTGATFSKTTGKTKIKKSDRKLKEKLRATERTSARRAAAIKRKTAEINDLKKQIRNLKKQRSCDHKLITRVRKNCVLYDSLKNEGRKLRSRQYSDQTKKFALSLYLSGPRTYRMPLHSVQVMLSLKSFTLRRLLRVWVAATCVVAATAAVVATAVLLCSGAEAAVVIASRVSLPEL